jgi:2-keto-4-pentenoate hydratase/2-oxohepta-3-ene-1,7-dioic acid hydratase in catechol pathway
MGKSFDTFAPIGPAIVTGITNPQELGLRTFVNNKKMQSNTTGDMIFRVDEIISYVSQVLTLQPGDLIFTVFHD